MYKFHLQMKYLLEHGVRYAPDEEIVYRDLFRYTYKDFEKRVHRLASALQELGVKKGSKVAVLEWDSHRYLELYFAIPMVGAILHNVNVRLAPADILYILNHAEDEFMFVNKDFLPLIEQAKDKLPLIKNYVILTDDEMPETSLTDLEYEKLLEEGDENFEFPELEEDTIATLGYTTGTTGKPKGVYFTHRQLVLHTLVLGLNQSAFITDATFTTKDVYMPLTPMFHVHAWGVPYLATLLGAKQVYPGRYEPQMIMKLVLEEKVTFTHCVPTILQMVVNAIPEGVKLPGWKVIIGGAKLPKGLALAAEKKGITVVAGYGLSETAPVLTIANYNKKVVNLPEDQRFDFKIKTGIPTPLVQLRVVHEDMTDVKPDGKDMGEIVVRTPWLTPEYLKDPGKTEELWKGGWLHTKDVAVVDEYGYVTIKDRLKDVIKSGGEWISSLTLENLLSLHEAVESAAVIGIPDEKWDERPLAFVVLKPEYKDKVGEEDLKKHLEKFVENGTITKWAIPDSIYFLDSLPKTSVGKIDKKVLRERFRS